jgi:TATA-box binding protein (TBP) (component of TFIID and TFIIIB)
VVATAVLDQPVDLELLHERFPKNIVYDQEIYGGLVAYFKTEGMEGKVSIFWSGKLISLEAKSLEKAYFYEVFTESLMNLVRLV